jgi:hypothetical protein
VLSDNTLRLLSGLLDSQQINVGAGRDEIEAVLTARDELQAEIAGREAVAAPSRQVRRAQARKAAKKKPAAATAKSDTPA